MAINNEAFYYVTGPVHTFVRVRAKAEDAPRSRATLQAKKNEEGQTLYNQNKKGETAKIYFLGHTEKTPDIGMEPQYKPVFSSLSGEAVPDDKVFLGTNYKIVLDLHRFDIDVIHRLMTAPNFGRAGDILGRESYTDRGSLMFGNGCSFELWLQNSFFGTANALAYPNLPPGYYFYACTVSGIYPTSMTRDTKRVRLVIEPLAVRFGITNGSGAFSKNVLDFANLPDPG